MLTPRMQSQRRVPSRLRRSTHSVRRASFVNSSTPTLFSILKEIFGASVNVRLAWKSSRSRSPISTAVLIPISRTAMESALDGDGAGKFENSNGLFNKETLFVCWGKNG